MDYLRFLNGSDIRGVASAGTGKEVTLTEDAVKAITRGFIRWLYRKKEKVPGKDPLTLACGRDSRVSGPDILSWVKEAAKEDGILAADTGLSSTPSMFMATILPGFCYDGAVMITASHLPWERNGLKFFTCDGGLDSSDIKEILTEAGEELLPLPPSPPDKRREDLMDAYSEHLVNIVRQASGKEKPLEGHHIVVDAGSGAGGFYEEKVLKPLGADTSGSVLLEPDGHFPGHIPNPELPEAMESIKNAVLSSGADFGIIFDTDVDRAGAVLSDGRELNRNSLIAVLAAIILEEHPGTTIVTDSVTSSGLADFIREKGGIHHRFKRGYRNVIDEMVRLNGIGEESWLAIETSGHAAFRENYDLDDGAYVVTRLLIELAKGHRLQDRIASLREPAEAKEFRFDILEKDFKTCGAAIIEELGRYAEEQDGWELLKDSYEGVRVNTDEAHGNGWFMMRMSLHDPVLPLNIESDEAGGVKRMAEDLKRFFDRFEGRIDTSPLK